MLLEAAETTIASFSFPAAFAPQVVSSNIVGLLREVSAKDGHLCEDSNTP
jgi:hypothetical protein